MRKIVADTAPAEPIAVHVSNADTAGNTPARVRLDFLDGIRGYAALYVALYHTNSVYETLYGQVPSWFRFVPRLFGYGHTAVGIFIVLSGYCLMLPIARAGQDRMPDGIVSYFKRRAWRILPPYYAAAALGLVAAYLSYLAKRHSGNPETLAYVGFTGKDLLTHLFLVHNFSHSLYQLIDPPLWSVAAEAQIYFLLPFLFLPFLRKWGLAAMLSVAAVIGIAPHFILPARYNLDWTCPWFVLLFAMGCAAAKIGFAKDYEHYAGMRRAPWAAIALIVLIAWAALSLILPSYFAGDMTAHVFVGAASALLMIALAAKASAGNLSGPTGWLLRVLEARVSAWLGMCSYSIYLIHYIIEARVMYVVHAARISPPMAAVLGYAAALPIALAGAYVFYLFIERPTILRRSRLHSPSQAVMREVNVSAALN